MLQEM